MESSSYAALPLEPVCGGDRGSGGGARLAGGGLSVGGMYAARRVSGSRQKVLDCDPGTGVLAFRASADSFWLARACDCVGNSLTAADEFGNSLTA